jgi:hypothetical protein
MIRRTGSGEQGQSAEDRIRVSITGSGGQDREDKVRGSGRLDDRVRGTGSGRQDRRIRG